MTKLVTRAELARMIGISPAAVTKAAKGPLAAALSGKRIDLDHPDAKSYVRNRDGASTKKSRKPSGSEAARTTKKDEALVRAMETKTDKKPNPADPLSPFLHYTLNELCAKFGTDVAFLDWLKAIKEIEVVEEKRLKNAATRGDLIRRDVVKAGVVDQLDSTFRRMLTDGAKTIATRSKALIEAGGTQQDLEKLVADTMTKFIRPCKTKIAKSVRHA